jgi:HSP20 family molecular chaperone IbpA
MAVSIPKVKTVERPMDWSLIEAAGENMLDRFQQDLRDRGLDIELFENRMRNLLRTGMPWMMMPAWQGQIFAPIDIEETGTEYLVRMSLPGIPKDLIAIRFFDQNLEIEAETKAVKETEKKNFVLHERAHAGYHRRINFPTMVAPEKAEAKLEHGVLTVAVPKLNPAKELRVPLR